MDPFLRTRGRAGTGIRSLMYAVLASSLLAGIKILSGIVGHAYVLIADGVESLLDLFTSLVTWGSLSVASAPPNSRFPYGYGKIEPLGTMVISLALLGAAFGIAVQSVREIISPHGSPAPFTLVVLVLVIVVKETIFRRLFRSAAVAGSRALEAEAWHHRSDALTSLAAFVGIALALLGGDRFAAADDWAALLACGLIAWNGSRLLRIALIEIMDVAPPKEVVDNIKSLALAVPGVLRLDLVRVRTSGLGLYVDLHIEVDGELSVREGHDLAHRVKEVLMDSAFPVLDALVHVEPSTASAT